MKLDYPNDAYNDESYGEYVDRKKSEAATDKMATGLLWLMFRCIRAILVYFPLFYVSYYLAFRITGEIEPDAWHYTLTLSFAYLLYCIIYFLKGILVKVKRRGNLLWILLWIICVAITCTIPIVMIQQLVESMYRPDKRFLTNARLISWGAGILFGVYVYFRYHFTADRALRIVQWSYRIGRNLF